VLEATTAAAELYEEFCVLKQIVDVMLSPTAEDDDDDDVAETQSKKQRTLQQ
jgi:hypothetical protein